MLAEKTGSVLLDAGPLLFTTDSVTAGIAIGLRGLAIALPGIYLLLSTDPTDLADALAQKLRLPQRFVLGALAAMRLVGLLVSEWQSLGMARRARGVGADAGALYGNGGRGVRRRDVGGDGGTYPEDLHAHLLRSGGGCGWCTTRP